MPPTVTHRGGAGDATSSKNRRLPPIDTSVICLSDYSDYCLDPYYLVCGLKDHKLDRSLKRGALKYGAKVFKANPRMDAGLLHVRADYYSAI